MMLCFPAASKFSIHHTHHAVVTLTSNARSHSTLSKSPWLMCTFIVRLNAGKKEYMFGVGLFSLFATLYFFHFIPFHSFVSNVCVYMKMKMSTYIIDYDSTIICNDLYNIRRKNDHFHNERMMKARAVFFFVLSLYALLSCNCNCNRIHEFVDFFLHSRFVCTMCMGICVLRSDFYFDASYLA